VPQKSATTYVVRRAILGGFAVAVIASSRVFAQAKGMPVVGYLSFAETEGSRSYVAGLRRGLAENGYVEGQNLKIEYRWAEGDPQRLPALAADLVQRQVAVIVTTGGIASALAAKAATATIPIVFTSGDDPIKLGLVRSYNRPGGNLTGVNPMIVSLDPKRLALLHEMVPGASLVAALFNPRAPDAGSHRSDVEAAARKLGVQLLAVDTSNPDEFDGAFESFARQHAGALLVTSDPLFSRTRNRVVALAAKYALPAVYDFRENAVAGGLMSYATDLMEVVHQEGIYAGRILKGDKPGDLPVVQPTTFDFVINLKTAKALGLTVPPNLLALADEVIE
jgi:putative tryptophan/tyrosine transport system substrate-binding protein